MKRRIELAVVLLVGVGLGVAAASLTGTARAAAGKGVKVSAKGKAAVIDVPAKPGRVYVALGERRGADGAGTVPLAQVLPPGRTRICAANLAGPLYLFEMRASLVFDRLNWNECTPQLCVDPSPLTVGRVVEPRFLGEICDNKVDDDNDHLVDTNDPDCQC